MAVAVTAVAAVAVAVAMTVAAVAATVVAVAVRQAAALLWVVLWIDPSGGVGGVARRVGTT